MSKNNRNSREALKQEANKWVKQAKKDAQLWRKLFEIKK